MGTDVCLHRPKQDNCYFSKCQNSTIFLCLKSQTAGLDVERCRRRLTLCMHPRLMMYRASCILFILRLIILWQHFPCSGLPFSASSVRRLYKSAQPLLSSVLLPHSSLVHYISSVFAFSTFLPIYLFDVFYFVMFFFCIQLCQSRHVLL